MSGLEVGLPETPLFYMPMSSPVKKCRHKGSEIKFALSLRITPDLGMLERQNLYLTLPWISLHPKINISRDAPDKLHTANDKHVGLLQTLLKSIC